MPTIDHKTLLREHRARVRKAANLFKAGKTDSRELDNCFEMHDGDLVVTALVRQAQTDPELAAAIYPKHAYWQTTAQEYALLSDAELAHEARRHIWKAWLIWEKQTATHRPEYCYVYSVVFDYGREILFYCDLDPNETETRLRQLGITWNNVRFHNRRLNEVSDINLALTGVAAFLRAFVADSGGRVIGHELTKGQLAANNTFNRDVDEQIRRVKKALPKHTGHPLHKAVADMASRLVDL